MHKTPSYKRQIARRIATYFLMSSAIVIGVIICLAWAMGFRFDFSRGEISRVGLIQFNTFPANSTVSLNGKILSGRTPTRANVNPGEISIIMSQSGYRDWQKTTNLSPASVLWLDYARLIPTSISTENLATFPNVSQFLASPNHNLILLRTSDADFSATSTGNIFAPNSPNNSSNTPDTFANSSTPLPENISNNSLANSTPTTSIVTPFPPNPTLPSSPTPTTFATDQGNNSANNSDIFATDDQTASAPRFYRLTLVDISDPENPKFSEIKIPENLVSRSPNSSANNPDNLANQAGSIENNNSANLPTSTGDNASTSANFSETFRLIEWSQNSRAVLLEHTFRELSSAATANETKNLAISQNDIRENSDNTFREFLLLNFATGDITNLSRDFSLDIFEVHFAGNSTSHFFALTDQKPIDQNNTYNLRELNYDNLTISSPLVQNVQTFASFSDSIFSYVAINRDKNQTGQIVGIYVNDKDIKIKSFATVKPTFSRYLQYNGQTFLAISRESTLALYPDPEKNSAVYFAKPGFAENQLGNINNNSRYPESSEESPAEPANNPLGNFAISGTPRDSPTTTDQKTLSTTAPDFTGSAHFALDQPTFLATANDIFALNLSPSQRFIVALSTANSDNAIPSKAKNLTENPPETPSENIFNPNLLVFDFDTLKNYTFDLNSREISSDAIANDSEQSSSNSANSLNKDIRENDYINGNFANLSWLDDSHLIDQNGTNFDLVEFDGANREFLSTSLDLGAVLSANQKFVFSIAKTGENQTLQRSKLVLE